MTTNTNLLASTGRHSNLLSTLRRLCEQGEPALYAVLRVAFAAILFTHGLPKLLGDGHGSMADPMAGSINLIRNAMGLPFAPQLAFLVMLLETGGAILLALGLGTRAIALIFALEMVGISYAMGPTWPWIDRGIEYPVLMAFLALYMAARGGGRYALDKWVCSRARQTARHGG
jgi:putative oxidoreductase